MEHLVRILRGVDVPMGISKEFVYTSEALRTDSWLKCGSFEGGSPSGMMCTTHKK